MDEKGSHHLIDEVGLVHIHIPFLYQLLEGLYSYRVFHDCHIFRDYRSSARKSLTVPVSEEKLTAIL